jgi:hypothetical protein
MAFEPKMDHSWKLGDRVQATDNPKLTGRIVLIVRWPGWVEDCVKVRRPGDPNDWWRAIGQLAPVEV